MIILSIIFFTVAMPLQSLIALRRLVYWSRIGFLVLIFSTFLSINNISVPLWAINGANTTDLSLFNGLSQSTLISGSIETLIIFIGGVLLAPAFSTLFSRFSSNYLIDLGGQETNTGLEAPIEYIIFTLCTVLGGIILCSSTDALTLLLGLELQSYSVYVIAAQYRGVEPSEAAGIKYYLLGALASALVLLGLGILYAVTGSTSFYTISSLILSTSELSETLLSSGGLSLSNNLLGSEPIAPLGNIVTLGFSLILIGLIWKIAGAPLHNWSMDVYDAVPTKSASWLAIVPKIAIITLIAELIIRNEGSVFAGATPLLFSPSEISSLADVNTLPWPLLSPGLSEAENILQSSLLNGSTKLILLVAMLSMIIGSVAAINQPLTKRLLAYSSVGQLGFILLAIGTCTVHGYSAFILYLSQYTLTTAGIWISLIIAGYYLVEGPLLGSHPNMVKGVNGLIKQNDFNVSNFSPKLLNTTNKYEMANYLPVIKYPFEIRSVTGLQGLHNENVFIATAMTLFLLSTAGIPPMIGFFAKLEAISAALRSGLVVLSIVAVISSLISASYYIRVIKSIWFSSVTDDEGLVNPEKTLLSEPSSSSSTILALGSLDRHGTKQSVNSSPTYINALIIAIITTIITLFVLQGSVILTWCRLASVNICT